MKNFTNNYLCWRLPFVPLAWWVSMGKWSLLCFQLMPWIYMYLSSRWPWDTTLTQFCMRKVILIPLPRCGTKFLDLHFSTTSFQNSLCLLKLLLFKCSVLSKMSAFLALWHSWRPNYGIDLTHASTCAQDSIINASLHYRLFPMTMQLLSGKPHTSIVQMRGYRVPKP